MQIILSDHNCEGQAQAIFDMLRYRGGWLELVPMELAWFRDVQLAATSDDEIVWRFCQEHRYLLLTGNRRTDDGETSLELIMQRLNSPTSLPIVTIGNLKRVNVDLSYCERCAERLAEIVYDLERYLGSGRLYLP